MLDRKDEQYPIYPFLYNSFLYNHTICERTEALEPE